MFSPYFKIFRREFTYMWRDKGLRYVLILIPLLSVLLFGLTYRAQVLTDIPTGVADLDNTIQSRELIQELEHAQNLEVMAHYPDYESLRRGIEKGEVVVGMVIPEQYGKKVGARQHADVSMIIDGSNMIYGINSSTAVMLITRTISGESGVKALLAKGININDAIDAFLAIDFREDSRFNPTINYAYFLVLGLILNIWQQCCTLLAAMTVIGETGKASWKQFKLSTISRFGLFASKSVAHIIIFMAVASAIYGLCFSILGLPLHCSFSLLLLFTLGFSISLHSIGTMISSFARNASDASRMSMVIAVPAFVLSGFTWPLEAMPVPLAAIVKWLPQTGFFQGVIALTMKDAGWSFVSHYFLQFIFIAVVCYGLTAVIHSVVER